MWACKFPVVGHISNWPVQHSNILAALAKYEVGCNQVGSVVGGKKVRMNRFNLVLRLLLSTVLYDAESASKSSTSTSLKVGAERTETWESSGSCVIHSCVEVESALILVLSQSSIAASSTDAVEEWKELIEALIWVRKIWIIWHRFCFNKIMRNEIEIKRGIEKSFSRNEKPKMARCNILWRTTEKRTLVWLNHIKLGVGKTTARHVPDH